MAESRHELIAVRLVDVLSSIVGDNGITYWYTPSVVGRWAGFVEALLDRTHSVLYWLIPGEEAEEDTEETSGEIAALATWNLVCARVREDGATDDPFNPNTPIRETAVNRMVRDVKKAIRSAFIDSSLAVTLNGYQGITNVEVKRTDRSAFADGWDLCFVSIVAHYSYHYAEP